LLRKFIELYETEQKVKLLKIQLPVLLYTSPLPPRSTLVQLKRLGFLDELPKSLKKIRETIEEVEKLGDERVFRYRIEETMSELKTLLETGERVVNDTFELVNTISVTGAVMISALMILTNPELAPITVIFFAVISMILAVLVSLVKYPRELAVPPPSRKYLLLYLISIPLYYFLGDTALSLLIPSLPLALYSYLFLKKKIREVDFMESLLEKARACTRAGINIYKCMEVEPKSLLEGFYGVLKAIAYSLYIIGVFGGERRVESLDKLQEVMTSYKTTFTRLRSRTSIVALYSIISLIVAAVSFAMIVETNNMIAALKIPSSYGITLPSKASVQALEFNMRISLTVLAIGLSLVSALLREGRWEYFNIYMPFFLAVSSFSFTLSKQYIAPLLLGGF